jgi:predicted DCC family thiol-disulfide oxidoreductase YuxK
METQQNQPTEVLYNAACPVCRREIEHYAEIASQQDLPIRFDDLNVADSLAGWRLESDTAARRLHVRKGNTVLSGIPAFILLWQEIPRYRWLARIVSLPGVNRLAIWTYDGILAPLLYRWHRFRVS